MRLTPAPPGRLLLGSAAASAVLGAAVLTVTPGAAPAPVGLGPQTVVEQLLRAVPRGASDVRVNGLYGSLVAGSWDFVADLVWRGPGGALHAGSTALPDNAGAGLVAAAWPASRLAVEDRLGWPAGVLAARLAGVAGSAVDVALVDFSPVAGRPVRLAWCTARASAAGRGSCASVDAAGGTARRWLAPLVVTPGGGPLAVRVRGGALDVALGGSG